jgi:hypothetical protein
VSKEDCTVHTNTIEGYFSTSSAASLACTSTARTIT